ncbi:MAG: RnfABCDGE type electron transport complex subunit D [Clostridiales bacterium]|nr:RnfABCDGE type electron transport complex subunit D [Clostridiales bacterium]
MNKVRSFMMDMIIMLLAVSVVAVYTYGIRALWSIILSVAAAILTEVIGYVVFMKKNPIRLADLSAIFTGLAVALALPSSAPFWLAPMGAIFAIAVAKLPFGDTTTQPFVPAAAGIGFVTLSWPSLMFAYPNLAIGKLSTVSTAEGFVPGTSLAEMLSQSRSIGTNLLNVLDIVIGRIPGPMGASCLILMIGTFLYLVIRKQPGAWATLSFVLTCAVIAFLFPRIMTGRGYSVLMELGAGLLFYCGVFFLADPATGPSTNRGRVLYGIAAGILTMILRRVGTYEESVIFVVLIMNAIADVFDSVADKLPGFIKKGGAKAREPKHGLTPALAEGEEPAEAPQEETAPQAAEEPQAEPEPQIEAEAAPPAEPQPEPVPEPVPEPAPEPAPAPEPVANPAIAAEVEALLAEIVEGNEEGGRTDE